MQWRTKEEAYQRTMLDWSWITDSLLSNLYAAHALSVHLSIKSPTSAHSRHHGSPTSLQTVLKRVWQNRSMWEHVLKWVS